MERKETLFVDGYNMIGAWPELAQLKRQDQIQAARDQLLFDLSNYSKYTGIDVIVVFDAQYVPGITHQYKEYNLTVVFTQEGETADSYIEREVREHMNVLNRVVVATSDAAEQWLIFQRGALRQSATELLIEIEYTKSQISQTVDQHFNANYQRNNPWKHHDFERLNFLRFYLGKQSKDS